MQRITPTHFIEVWKGITGTIYNNNIYVLDLMEYCLNNTKEIEGETIAIWKIKFKKL